MKEVTKAKTKKRYNLVIPTELYNQLGEIAGRDGMSVIDVMRRFIKVGLYIDAVSHTKGAKVIIRDGKEEREIRWE